MAASQTTVISQIIAKHEKQLLDQWLAKLGTSDTAGQAEAGDQARRFVTALRKGVDGGRLDDITGPDWHDARSVLEEVTRSRAQRGASPSQTAMFVFSLKEPIFDLLRREVGGDGGKFAAEIWAATLLLDKLGLYTTEVHQKSREDVIVRQQEELLELSTPVVQLWEGVLALPVIGTLDSARTQVVMESLLQEIVSSGAEIAIIDITGVPTVDTVVAQHLLKTISAARLMGADCIISGIRPQIAQTIVHLGVQLDVISKATMADAFALALRRLGKTIAERDKGGAPKPHPLAG